MVKPHQRLHLSQSVAGALAHWEDRMWREVCRGEDGRWLTPKEVKAEFERLHAEGVELIPFGDCDNFDPKKGCLGHPIPEDPPTAAELKAAEREASRQAPRYDDVTGAANSLWLVLYEQALKRILAERCEKESQ